MDLSRAINKFATTPIEQWDKSSADWIATDFCGALAVFDRFITERTFGQKKRILTVSPEMKLDLDITTVRMQGSEETFLVEKFNEDVRNGELYAYIYLLHEAPFYADINKTVTTTNAAGVKVTDGTPLTVESIWIDIDRFSGAPSRTFEDTEYTITTMTFPRDSLVDTDSYALLTNGERYNVDEIYTSLDLIGARGKRIGL